MSVYAIDRPDAAGARTIALAVYPRFWTRIVGRSRPSRPSRCSSGWPQCRRATPRKLLLDAFGTAQLANRDYLVPEDIDAKKLCGRKSA
jgi:hypothetical protein